MLGSASSPQVDLDCIIEGTIFPPGSCICLCFRSFRGPTVMGFGQCFITGSETKQSVLDPATSLKVLIISRRFLVEVLGSLTDNMSPLNRDKLTCSFPIYIPLIYFSGLIFLARASDTVWKSSGSSTQSRLISDFSGIILSFSPFRMVFLNLWVVTQLRVGYQISYISDIFVMIHNCQNCNCEVA